MWLWKENDDILFQNEKSNVSFYLLSLYPVLNTVVDAFICCLVFKAQTMDIIIPIL